MTSYYSYIVQGKKFIILYQFNNYTYAHSYRYEGDNFSLGYNGNFAAMCYSVNLPASHTYLTIAMC